MQGGVLASAPYAPTDSFFHQGQKHTISNIRGEGIFIGGIFPLCFESAVEDAPYAQRLHTSLKGIVTL